MKQFLALVLLLAWVPAAAAETAFQFAAPNHQSPKDPDVNGMRLSIFHGKNRSVRGFDFGILSLAETSNLSGLALVLGMSKVNGPMSGGACLSLVNIHSGNDRGLNAAFVNRLGSADSAVDISFINIADGTTMLDIGGLNVSKSSTAQLGIINVTEQLKGFQFGALNIAENGFLPIFPIFNFPKN